MDNSTKISNEQIENLKAELQKGDGNKSAEELMKKYLNREQTETIKKVLANPEKVREIMSSPLAKSFLEKFSGKKKE